MTDPYSDLWPGGPAPEEQPELALKIRFLEGDLQRLQARPGDAFVLMVDEDLSMDQAQMILTHWNNLFPGTKLLVLPRGYRLGAVEGLK